MMKHLVLVCLFIFASACGGGGSGGSELTFFGGVYRVTFAILENTCDNEQASFDDMLTVNQANDRIVADSPNYGNYVGSPTGDNSFAVTRTETVICVDRYGNPNPESTAALTDTYMFTEVTEDSAVVTNTYSWGNCSGNVYYDSSCYVIARGSAVRMQ